MHVGTRGTCLTHNVLSLKQTENTGGATSNTCCLNARVFWAREARWRLHSSGMTSLRHVWGLSMRRRCCLRHFLLIVPLLWLPRLVSSRSSSTLLLPWDVPPPLAHEVAVRVTSRGVLAWCVGCGVHGAVSVGVGVGRPSPSCLVVRPFVVALPTVWSFVCAGAASCAYFCSAHVRPCAQGRCGRCPPGSGVMSEKKNCFFLPWPEKSACHHAPLCQPGETSAAQAGTNGSRGHAQVSKVVRFPSCQVIWVTMDPS